MSVVNIICSICTEVFRNSDEVFSTKCGHLFHIACLNDWLRREDSCPQCRQTTPTPHRLHLSFIDLEEPTLSREDLEISIKSSEEKVAELLTQFHEVENNCRTLEEQCSSTVASNQELEEELRQTHNAEEDFLRLQAQYTDISEIRKELEDHINQLFIENERKIHQLKLKTDENEQLKSNLDTKYFALPNNALGEKVRGLEQKLKILTRELEKEIDLSTKLSIDKNKLQSHINEANAVNKGKQTLKEKSSNNNNVAPQRLNAVNKGKQTLKEKNSNNNNVAPQRLLNSFRQNFNRYENSVVIKGLSVSQLTSPLENAVLNLASKMKIELTTNDLIVVDILNADLLTSNCAVLSVQFKEFWKKLEFLANENTLQDEPNAKSIVIEDFMGDELRELFIYANQTLHNCGMTYFYIENNKVFAKRHHKHPNAVYIYSKGQVDDIAFIYNSQKLART